MTNLSRILSNGTRPGLVCAALWILGTSHGIAVQNADAPKRGAGHEGISSTGTWPFSYDDRGFRSGALLDLRALNEKEAGETGFLRLSADGNSFVTGAGKPIRFWAVVSDIYRLKPDDMAKHARFLAKLGVNMVRLHTQIAPTGKTSRVTDVNEKEIDGIWRAVSALKKEGIYTTLSPYWATDKDANEWGLEGVNGQGGLWGLLFFNETLREGYKSWVKVLYGRKNPYTGIPLAKDTSVGIIQVQNEDGMFFWTMQAMKPEQQEILGRKFGRWLVKRYSSLASAKETWGNASHEKDDFARGRVGLFITYFLTQPQQGGLAKRLRDQTQFFAETQYQFYQDMAGYYRNDLGCKQLINASNWITADPVHMNDLERYTYTANEVVAVNKYTGGVHTGANNGWRIDPGHHFSNQSFLLDPRNFPSNLKQVTGHPMMIMESTWVSPEGFQSEGPLTMAAYQSLTGIDTFYWFAAGGESEYEGNPYFTFLNFPGGRPLHKWTCATPALMGTFPAAALMFRLGYVKQGEPIVHEERTLEEMWNRATPMIAEDRSFDPNRYTGNTGEKSNILKGADPLAFLVGPVEVKYGGDHAKSHVADLTRYIDTAKKTVKSVTGEIHLNYGEGLFTLNAPKAQAASGFLRKAGDIVLSDVTIRSGNDYATVAIVSMDDLPLKTSTMILAQVGAYVRPTGWQSRATDFKSDDGKQTFHGYEILNTGTAPWQVQNTDVMLTLRNPKITKAILLDTACYPVKVLSVTRAGGNCSLQLPANAMYVILE